MQAIRKKSFLCVTKITVGKPQVVDKRFPRMHITIQVCQDQDYPIESNQAHRSKLFQHQKRDIFLYLAILFNQTEAKST